MPRLIFAYLLDDHFNDADRSLYRFDLLDEAERPDLVSCLRQQKPCVAVWIPTIPTLRDKTA